MADINQAVKELGKLEFSSPSDLLHKNDGENGLTFFGIYQSANPEWRGWSIISRYLANEPDIKKCSVILSNVTDLLDLVYKLYKQKYWDLANLDLVTNQHTATEIFIFGVNIGMKLAIKKTQKLLGLEADGDVGPKTLEALNKFNTKDFDIKFDEVEIAYYEELGKQPRFVKNEKGWINRAKAY